MGKINDLAKYTQEIWGTHYGDHLSLEDAREVIANVSQFFDLLYEWEQNTTHEQPKI